MWVKKIIKYIIPVVGLSLGDHHYTYIIDGTFFSNFEYFDTDKGMLDLEIDMVKESNLIDFKFHFKLWVELVCDRCSDWATYLYSCVFILKSKKREL